MPTVSDGWDSQGEGIARGKGSQVLLVRKTRSKPMAEPIKPCGPGAVRGKNRAGKLAIAYAHSIAARQMGHSAARTVEKRHCRPGANQERCADERRTD